MWQCRTSDGDTFQGTFQGHDMSVALRIQTLGMFRVWLDGELLPNIDEVVVVRGQAAQ